MLHFEEHVSAELMESAYAIVLQACGEKVAKAYLLRRTALPVSVIAMQLAVSKSKAEEMLAAADRVLSGDTPACGMKMPLPEEIATREVA